MDITLRPHSRISGSITAPPSKSDAHRALICAALSGGAVRGAGDSDDIRATLGVLEAFGARGNRSGDVIRFAPPAADATQSIRSGINTPVADCGESGSTLRFLLPVCGALGLKMTFTGRGRLPRRPIGPILDEMTRHGVRVSAAGADPVQVLSAEARQEQGGESGRAARTGTERYLPLTVSGQLEPGEYVLPGDISSQFISGFLLALSVIGGSVRVEGRLESSAYVDMTVATLASFGVRWTQRETQGGLLFTRGDSGLTAPAEPYQVAGDWSGAAFPLAAGALGGAVTVRGLRDDSLQGDRAVADILARMGAEVLWSADAVTVRRNGPLKPVTVDVSGIPDLFPVLAAAACGADGDSVFENGVRLRIKESDRIESTADMLRSLGGRVSVDGDRVTVHGTGRLPGGTVDSRGDHRIAMSGAVASVICEGPVTLLGAECSSKSYPAFFENFSSIGGETW